MKNRPLFTPFVAIRPAAQEKAKKLAAPPYDVLSSAEAGEMARENPLSFLHVSKPEIDCPEDATPPDIYAAGARFYHSLLSKDALIRDDTPSFYIYRAQMGEHVQTGIAGLASVAGYRAGKIKRHEHTLVAKENDRAAHIETLGAQTGPALLMFKASARLRELLKTQTEKTPPLYEVTGPYETHHALWQVSETSVLTEIETIFEDMDALYIADGHHRTAAAARLAEKLGGDPSSAHNGFLAVAFPDDEMQILPYLRAVRDLNGLSSSDFLGKLEETFRISPLPGPRSPEKRGDFTMCLEGKWYALAPLSSSEALDVAVLSDSVLAPILGITDLRRDPRISFIGGIRGLGELEKSVQEGNAAVCFALYPTAVSQVMAVSDRGEVMPPKSTWFEPKLLDGLLSNPLS